MPPSGLRLPQQLAAHLGSHSTANRSPSGSGGGEGCGEGGGARSEVIAAYGEGLAALLGHLAASRKPQVQAWLQLKEDLMASDEATLAEGGWDDLNDLEQDFLAVNSQHLAKKAWLTT